MLAPASLHTRPPPPPHTPPCASAGDRHPRHPGPPAGGAQHHRDAGGGPCYCFAKAGPAACTLLPMNLSSPARPAARWPLQEERPAPSAARPALQAPSSSLYRPCLRAPPLPPPPTSRPTPSFPPSTPPPPPSSAVHHSAGAPARRRAVRRRHLRAVRLHHCAAGGWVMDCSAPRGRQGGGRCRLRPHVV